MHVFHPKRGKKYSCLPYSKFLTRYTWNKKIFVVWIDYKKGLYGIIKNGVWMSAQEAY